MVGICSGGEILAAGADPEVDQDMLSLSLTLPRSTGGSVRRALLRSQAEILSRQADAVGRYAPFAVCVHCRESEAMLAVVEQLQRVARAVGISGRTIDSGHVILPVGGQVTPG